MKNISNISKKIISWVALITLVLSVVFESSTSITNAQQSNQLRATCAPNKPQVQRNEDVTFIATVENRTNPTKYSWGGASIRSVDAPRVTTKYASLGRKRATLTVVSGGTRVRTECFVTVVANIQQQAGQNQNQQLIQQLQQQLQGLLGGNQNGQNQNQIQQIQQQIRNLGGTPTTGGTQTGGQTTGGQSTPTQQTQSQREQAAQQRAIQDYNRKQQQAEQDFEKEKQKCEEGSSSGSVADDIQSSYQKPEEFGQLVPTDPKPIVDPIDNLRENIERLTAKEIGLKDQREPPLDQKVACKVDAGVKKVAEQTKNTIQQGRDGNPWYITDHNALIEDGHDIGTKEFIEALANDQSCKSEENQALAKAFSTIPRSIIGVEASEESCQVNQEKDLNKLETYLDYSSPENNPAFKMAGKYSALIAHRTETVGLIKYQSELNDGFIPVKDEDGKITNPPRIYVDLAIYGIDGTRDRFGELDETTEDDSDLYAEFLGKARIDTPTGAEEFTPDPRDRAV